MKTRRDEAKSLRDELARRTHKRWMGPDLRERSRAYVIRRCESGATCADVARELGLSQQTIHRWMQSKNASRKAPTLLPVQLVETKTTHNVSVTTPRGLRIEGLDLDALCTFVARLG